MTSISVPAGMWLTRFLLVRCLTLIRVTVGKNDSQDHSLYLPYGAGGAHFESQNNQVGSAMYTNTQAHRESPSRTVENPHRVRTPSETEVV